MRNALRNHIYVLLLLLSGCGVLSVNSPERLDSTDPIVILQNTIDQAYATHAAITSTLLQNYHDGIITKAEKDEYARKTRAILTDLNTADDFFTAGDFSSAETRAKLVTAAFTQVQLELAKRAKEKKGN